MEVETPPESTPDIEWVATWGDQVKVGDLVKVTKLGGPVRIKQLRVFQHSHPRQALASEQDDGHWYYGAVVTDRTGKEFHVFIQPIEPVFLAVEVPKDLSIMEDEAEGPSTDGVDG